MVITLQPSSGLILDHGPNQHRQDPPVRMENIVSLRNISWITEEPVDLREYFDDYHKLLDEAGNSEQEMVHNENAVLSFLKLPEQKASSSGVATNVNKEKFLEESNIAARGILKTKADTGSRKHQVKQHVCLTTLS
ncbi:uncharacterized protein LOC122263718 [Penaeus japonicus]|uniref:uncharacterized protein LOC122263718 n=1 Tax=Penaeus japonicus TaxID=27405 RepID=UPI001C71024C|nr:uncharacterized protein LOC122263718 [Penaeus japonicus]